MKKTLLFLSVIVVGVFVWSMARQPAVTPLDTTPDDGRVRAAEQKVLSIGETQDITGMLVTFDEIVSDSRCPTDVQCIWMGTLVVGVTLSLNGDERPALLELGMGPVAFGGYLVSLVGAEPQSVSGNDISIDAYQLTIRVEPATGSDGVIPATI